MSSRTARNMVAELPDGTESSWRTGAQNHDWAGFVRRADGATEVVARGWSADAVASRTYAAARREYPGATRDTAGIVSCCVPVTEETAPALRKYFGTHRVAVTAVFTDGWTILEHPLKAGRSDLRRMARQGVSGVQVRRLAPAPEGDRAPWQGDFTMQELVKSMNSRKGR